ncbi:piggyBac transposable element-derived protein 4-like [Engystomops pustulosus]|uniref:piggyBac transposable element-derived protein 4-like n=1 Tax=Engystomops pustulosus TaxID=76066 RepID=UPI003AFADB3B
MSRKQYTAEEAYALLQSDSEFETASDMDYIEGSDNASVTSESSTGGVSGDVDAADKEVAGPSSVVAPIIEARTLPWEPAPSFTPRVNAFTVTPGITVDDSSFAEMDFFLLFLSDTLLDHIVHQTNLYATQYIRQNPLSVHAREWTPTNIHEIKKFWGLTINMGIVKKPKIRSYWSKNPIQVTPVYSAVMSRSRYEHIMRFLHFSDNSQAPPSSDPNRDRLYKLRPLINMLNQSFIEKYLPEQNVVVDESLLSFHGRLSFRQYLPSKRARYGIKLYKLCESESGYTTAFRIYEGRDRTITAPGCSPDLSTSSNIVWEIMQPLLHKGYHLYCDNFYTSVALFRHLHAANTGACGTMRKNRKGFSQQLVGKALKKGESCAYACDELLAVKYRDRKDVYLLSTIHSAECVSVRERGAPADRQKPVSVAEYNKYMGGGVDLSDQVLQPYLVKRKTKTWYKKVAIYLIQIGIHNAFVLYKKKGGRDTYLDFQEKIIEGLIFEPQDTRQSLECEKVKRLTERHFISPIPATETRNYPQKRCRVCSKNGQRRDSRYFCASCPSQPGLCIHPCYKKYHTVLNY